MKVSHQGEEALTRLLEKQEKDYLECVRMVAHYGADQDGWHGEAYAMHYAEQLKSQHELMRLKDIYSKREVVETVGDKIGIGSSVKIEIEGKIQKFFIDGFRYENNPSVLTPETPLGKVLIGKKSGDNFKYETSGNVIIGKIL